MNEMYQGIAVESESEIMVLDWLFELKEKGFIHSIERSPELLISRGLDNRYVKRTVMKTKTKEEPKSQIILQPHYYTPEFSVQWFSHTPNSIVWAISGIGLEGCIGTLIGHSFPIVHNTTNGELRQQGLITYLEVKPKFDFQNMGRLFKLNQKWVWESRKMFINLLEPTQLFKSTFTPDNYLKTRKTKTEREIKWEIVSCNDYLKSIGYESNDRTGVPSVTN